METVELGEPSLAETPGATSRRGGSLRELEDEDRILPWSVRRSTGFCATRIFRPFSEISFASSSSGVMSIPDGIRVEMSIPVSVSEMIDQCVLVAGAQVSFDLALLFVC